MHEDDFDRAITPVLTLNLTTDPKWIKLVGENGRTLWLDCREIGGAVHNDGFTSAPHLCVDAHAFIDGERVTIAAWGMSNGRPQKLDSVGTTSHGHPSAAMAILIVGNQAGELA